MDMHVKMHDSWWQHAISAHKNILWRAYVRVCHEECTIASMCERLGAIYVLEHIHTA